MIGRCGVPLVVLADGDAGSADGDAGDASDEAASDTATD